MVYCWINYANLHSTMVYCWINYANLHSTMVYCWINYANLHSTMVYCWINYANLHSTMVYCWILRGFLSLLCCLRSKPRGLWIPGTDQCGFLWTSHSHTRSSARTLHETQPSLQRRNPPNEPRGT